MKFLCISAPIEENDKDNNNRFNLRLLYSSIRKSFFRKNKKPRVTISEPTVIEHLSQNELIQLNGVITVVTSVDTQSSLNANNKTNDLVTIESGDVTDGEPITSGELVAAESSSDNDTQNRQQIDQSLQSEEHSTLTKEQNVSCVETSEQIVVYSWFWGSISRREAEALLRGQRDGSFLVRKSSDERFLYSLSFRSNGKTMHTRIEHVDGQFSFYSKDSDSSKNNDGSKTLGELISVAMNQNSADNIFFYSRRLRSETSLHTVSLNQPLSRYQYLLDYSYESNESKSLQYMCKFVVHHCPKARFNLNQQLQSLPLELKTFAENEHFFPRKTPL